MYTTKINIIQQNLRKSRYANDELKDSLHNTSTDILILQEPNIFNNNYVHNLNCKHYNNLPYTSTIIVNNTLNTNKIDKYCNSFATTIEIITTHSKIILSNIYILPNSFNDSHTEFFNDLIHEYNNFNIIVTGDFNARCPLWHDTITNHNGRFLKDFIETNDLIIHNNKDKTCRDASIVDLTITNFNAFYHIQNWKTDNLTNISDHKTIMFDITLTSEQFASISNFSTFKFKELESEWETFKNNINTDNLSSIETLSPTIENIDYSINTLTNTLIDAARLTFRPRLPKTKSSQPSWWTRSLHAQRKYFKYIKNLYYRHSSNVTSEDFIKIRKHYYSSIRKAKRDSFRNFLEEVESSNPFGNTYKIIKKISTPPKYDLPFIDKSDYLDKQSKMQELISALFPDDSPSEDSDYHKLIREEDHSVYPLNQNMLHSDSDEIISIVSKLSHKKAPGPDFITNNMIKKSLDIIIPYLVTIFNNCISIGYFPTEWKKAIVKIIPKPKKEDYNNPKNYRPISLLSNIGKIFEKVINIKLSHYLKDKLNPNQHGFIQGKSTISALSEIIESSIIHKNEHKTAIISLDISSAFDKAWWPMIIHQLYRFHIPQKIIKLIESFLQNRTISFFYSNLRTQKSLTRGCPQGSALSPTLWNILFDYIISELNTPFTKTLAYADDITIVCWDINSILLKNRICSLMEKTLKLCIDCKMDLNNSKTQILYLYKNPSRLTINSVIIHPASQIKILGLTFKNHRLKSKLDFSSHINNIIKNVTFYTKILFCFVKNTFGINFRKRLILFKSVIRPKILYGFEIWTKFLTKRLIHKLESLQHKILLKTCSAYRTVSRACINVLTGIPPITFYINIITSSKTIAPQDKKQFIKRQINEKIEQCYLETNDNFKAFISLPLPKSLSPNFYNTQFITGHGKFNEYLHRIGKESSPFCPCSASTIIQNPIHITLSCTNCPFHINNTKLNNHNIHEFNKICKSHYLNFNS